VNSAATLKDRRAGFRLSRRLSGTGTTICVATRETSNSTRLITWTSIWSGSSIAPAPGGGAADPLRQDAAQANAICLEIAKANACRLLRQEQVDG